MRRTTSIAIMPTKSSSDTEDELWEEDRNTKSFEREENISSTVALIQEHTKIFASMCPDEILDNYDDYETRIYHTTLMIGDVSGFTELTEKYTKSGQGGPSKLTDTLNSYIGAMVQEILSHEGDVLKFSGDAFIVMWKLQEGKVMRDLVNEAMKTACSIQQHFGTYNTDVGVTLRVKLAISSGKIYFTSIGDPNAKSYYIITGRPVWDAKYAESLCRGGDILVANSCWKWANPNEYIHKALPDGIHTLILGLSSSMWYHVDHIDESDGGSVNSDNNERTGKRSGTLKYVTNDRPEDRENRAVLMNLTGDAFDEKSKIMSVDYSLRPKIVQAAKARVKDSLRRYMLRPVVRSVEMNEPLEYLTEMRQVVIVFVNVITASLAQKGLISLVNSAYQSVCRIVGKMEGCVNKTSLFDKDLIFLCIFGLRGDKHEIESQIGLKCAAKIHRKLSEIQDIESITVAVTTGITYCGVVGHILRREYTVIGSSVNKAARLMVAYKNKVVCDRESFIYSRLGANHFILQEAKYLKGITYVGPVYEFNEQGRDEVSNPMWISHPLLGRHTEIKTFKSVLKNVTQYVNFKRSEKNYPHLDYNTLIIRGEQRIGKTRILDEISHNVPTRVFCNYISLVSSDKEKPYTTIHLIFSMPLGFTASSSLEEREDKLLRVMGKITQPEYLCAFNDLFNVRFPITRQYKLLSVSQKRKILRKLLSKLTKRCFNDPWVIIVDDADYIDEDSTGLFDAVTKRNETLFILSFCSIVNTGYSGIQSNFLKRAKVLDLTGIDKWYHAGLACQVLGVRGIPAELEKLIQEKSSGNPGWIESYLLSLIQAGDLVITDISKKNAEIMGYVLPPLEMLTRMNEREKHNVKENNPDTGEPSRKDSWRMYSSSFRDSITMHNPFSVINEPSSTFENPETLIAICKISESCNLANLNTELTMDVITLKLFDALSHLDKLLLKCASVIGEIIHRDMLESLMEPTNNRDIAFAVSKLFELRVFGCAMGNFTDGTISQTFYHNKRSLSFDKSISCRCIGLKIRDELRDMPSYATCGLIRFKTVMFRETTYRLLTDHQKVELHGKALKYLRLKTRRCISCGEGQFATLLDDGLVFQDPRHTIDVHQLLKRILFGEIPYLQKFENSIDQVEKPKVRAGTNRFCFRPNRKLERKSTTSFSHVDYNECQCESILMTVYSRILEHCRDIGRKDLTLTLILAFAEVSLSSCNAAQARRLLIDGEALSNDLFASREEGPIIASYLIGKIKTLQGKCYLESGLISEAEIILNEAMNSLGYKFPSTKLLINLKSSLQLQKLRIILKYFPAGQVDIGQRHQTIYNNQLASCLNCMFDVYRIKGMKEHARLTAIWGFKAALKSNIDFLILGTSYANMLITAHIYQNVTIIPYLETGGIVLCRNKMDLDIRELRIVVEIYAAIFFSRWLQGKIKEAINIGFITSRLAHTNTSTFLKIIVLPRLVYLLMISDRYSEVNTVLRELEFVSSNDVDKSGRTWYHALCVEIYLDTGYRVLSFQDCESHFLKEDRMMNFRDPEAYRRYITVMWLWCVRLGQWETAEIWKMRNTTEESIMDEYEVAATFTALREVEGQMITYVRMVSSKNTRGIELISQIKKNLDDIAKMLKTIKVIAPRYWLMTAYYHMIRYQKNTAIKLLDRAMRISAEMGNKMIHKWAQHCKKSWTECISTVETDLWRDRSDVVNKWNEVNANEKVMIPFTLPILI